MQQDAPRRLLGLGTVCALALIADLLPSGPAPIHLIVGEQDVFVPTIWAVVASFAAFAAGGYVARSGFMPVAMSFAIMMWGLGQYIVYQIAVPAGQADIVVIVSGNVLSLLMIVITAALGAFAGEQLFRRRNGLSPTTS